MVKQKRIGRQVYFQCGICGFFYKEKDFAEKCEDFCDKHKGCSLEITKHAVQINSNK